MKQLDKIKSFLDKELEIARKENSISVEDKIADILIERAEQETSEISVTAVKDEIKVSYKK